MTDHDTLELRRMVDSDPVEASLPDLPDLIRSGRRIRTRRRVLGGLGGGVALGAAAALAVPLLTVAGGGPADVPATATDTAAPASASGSPAPAETRCGVLSCVHAASSSVETGQVLDELTVGTLPGGATEVIYVARNPGAGTWKGQTVEVLSSGYRLDGRLRRTAWALQPGSDGPDAPRFWTSPELANGRPGDNDHYAVLGYVDGSPEEITWSTPDGRSGEVDGLLRLDGYTAFYVSQPMPADYVPPPLPTKNPDGSFTIETENGPRTFRSGDRVSSDVLMGNATDFAPDLTIRTSEGWSCTLEECGTSG